MAKILLVQSSYSTIGEMGEELSAVEAAFKQHEVTGVMADRQGWIPERPEGVDQVWVSLDDNDIQLRFRDQESADAWNGVVFQTVVWRGSDVHAFKQYVPSIVG